MVWVGLAAAAFLFSGLAIAYVIGGAAVLAFIATDNARYLAILPQQIFSKIDVFALMAMPLFILAGELMNKFQLRDGVEPQTYGIGIKEIWEVPPELHDEGATLHTIGAFLMLIFLIVHIYLTTTGHTPLAHIKAMITGWEEVED